MIENEGNGVRIKGRGISKGRAEGTVKKSSLPLSLVNDINLKTSEILKRESEIYAQPIKNEVMVFPHCEETMDYSNPLSNLKDKGLHPKAIIAGYFDTMVAKDAMNSDIPALDGVDISLLETGDYVVVDATNGFVSLKQVTLKNVATSVLTHDDKLLILRRSSKVGTYKGRWACISGYVEKGERSEDTARREVLEEVGLKKDEFELIRRAQVLYARDKDVIWAVHPFHFDTKKAEIKLDWEHIEYKWISPRDIENYATVPKLKETIESALMDARNA